MSAEPAPATSPDTPEPELSFDSMPLSSEVRRALDEMGYETPTPVQAAVFEAATSGRDCIVQARTGTGKTSAFGLPLVDRLVSKTPQAQALILCPTRELALQVSRELDKLSAHRPVSTVAVYGGAPMGRQIERIKQGAQIVVGTPGRTLDHMRRRTLDPTGIKTLVLDESDEMLSMGFERELTAIMEHLPDERQTLLFSATLPPDTERLAKNRLTDPELVILSGDHIGALEVVHYVYMVNSDKIAGMLNVIDTEDPESAVVFCNTKDMTERLANALRREGYDADWLNGDLPQSEREVVMKKTREGKLRFLVATDVAARGIDISHLTHVINFDFPQDAEAYVHRTGRTGRAGRTGTALSLVTPRDIGSLYMLRLTYKIRPIERRLPSALEQQTRAEADIVTSLATTFVARGQSPEHLALARRLLTHDDAEGILAGILREHLSTNPELPELAQSRRRARTIKAPAANGEDRKRPERGRRKRGRRRDAEPAAEPASEAKPSQAKPSEAKPSEAKPSEAKPSEAKPSEAKPSEAKPSKEPQHGAPAANEKRPRKSRPSTRQSNDLVELHVDAGRRDGARVQALKSILADAGVALDEVRRVRVRERYTFVEVTHDVEQAAIAALTGATLGDRTLTAKVSERSK